MHITELDASALLLWELGTMPEAVSSPALLENLTHNFPKMVGQRRVGGWVCSVNEWLVFSSSSVSFCSNLGQTGLHSLVPKERWS